MPWFTGSRFWFTLKVLVRGTFSRVNQKFCLISDFIASDLRFSAGSRAAPYGGKPLLNHGRPRGLGAAENWRPLNADFRTQDLPAIRWKLDAACRGMDPAIYAAEQRRSEGAA